MAIVEGRAGGERECEAIQLSKNDVVGSAKRQARSKAGWGDRRGAYTTEMGKFKPKSRGLGGGAEVLEWPGVVGIRFIGELFMVICCLLPGGRQRSEQGEETMNEGREGWAGWQRGGAAVTALRGGVHGLAGGPWLRDPRGIPAVWESPGSESVYGEEGRLVPNRARGMIGRHEGRGIGMTMRR